MVGLGCWVRPGLDAALLVSVLDRRYRQQCGSRIDSLGSACFFGTQGPAIFLGAPRSAPGSCSVPHFGDVSRFGWCFVAVCGSRGQ